MVKKLERVTFSENQACFSFSYSLWQSYFLLCSTRNALKVIQIKWGKPNKFEINNLKPTVIIRICQICEAIVRKCLISRVESVLTAPCVINKVVEQEIIDDLIPILSTISYITTCLQ